MKVRKKAKLKKKVYFVLAGLAAVPVAFVSLLLYKPAHFSPPDITYNKQVSPYLTHELLPHIYNNAQLGEPFDLTIIQNKTKDIIALTRWPKELDGLRVSAPQVLFVADGIVLRGTVAVRGVQFVVTIVAEAGLDQEGLLNLRVAKVKIGAMNITALARMLAKRIYQRRFAMSDIDAEDWRAQIAASLLDNEPFAPVFEIEDRKVRADKITITQGKLTIHLVPAYD
ncbi:hypothetical protein ES703_72935 [subsurface metagenome]